MQLIGEVCEGEGREGNYEQNAMIYTYKTAIVKHYFRCYLKNL